MNGSSSATATGIPRNSSDMSSPTSNRKRTKPTQADGTEEPEASHDIHHTTKAIKVESGEQCMVDGDFHVNILISLEYHGTYYGGWQRHGPNNHINYPSVQGTVEEAATKACLEFAKNSAPPLPLVPTNEGGDSIAVMAGTSGRTDRGVHALDHYCLLRLPFRKEILLSENSGLCDFLIGSSKHPSFKENSPVTSSTFLQEINRHLPCDIFVKTCQSLSQHERKNLNFCRKRYRYLMHQAPDRLNRPWMPWNAYTYFVKFRLDIDKMNRAAQYMVGTHDFLPMSCQRVKEREVVNTVRTIYEARVTVMDNPFTNVPWFVQACRSDKAASSSRTTKINRPDENLSIFDPPDFGLVPNIKNYNSNKDEKPHNPNNHPKPEECKIICIEFEGNGFLTHQVRRMVSLLQKVGEGIWPPECVLDILKEDGSQKSLLQGQKLAPGRALWKAQVTVTFDRRANHSKLGNAEIGEDIEE